MSTSPLPIKSGSLSWRIANQARGVIVEMAGNIDESVKLDSLANVLKGAVTFDLAKVDRINSCGVREWVNLLRDLAGKCSLTLTKCSEAVVMQLNMVSNFSGGAVVESVYGPYVCDDCGRSESRLLQVSDIASGRKPTLSCDSCNSTMSFDELFDRYFAFVLDK